MGEPMNNRRTGEIIFLHNFLSIQKPLFLFFTCPDPGITGIIKNRGSGKVARGRAAYVTRQGIFKAWFKASAN
jgi:hypothetical protein